MTDPRMFEQFHGFDMVSSGEFEIAFLHDGKMWREPLIGWIAGMTWLCRMSICQGLDDCEFMESHERLGTSVNPVALVEGVAQVCEDGEGPATNSCIVPKAWPEDLVKHAIEDRIQWQQKRTAAAAGNNGSGRR